MPTGCMMAAAVCAALALSSIAVAGDLPDPKLTPGEANPVLTQQKICAKGFSTTAFRHVTAAMKAQVYARYGMKPRKGACGGKEGCEVDHLLPIEAGGANSLKNLWPQIYPGVWGAHVKDKLENRLHKNVCNGRMTLQEAQICISENWILCYKKVMLERK